MFFLIPTLLAASPKYRECSVVGGAVSGCGSPYTGEVVQGTDGGDDSFLKSCSASDGSITSCSGMFTGTTVLGQPLGGYHACSVKDGKVFWCDPKSYEGSAILQV